MLFRDASRIQECRLRFGWLSLFTGCVEAVHGTRTTWRIVFTWSIVSQLCAGSVWGVAFAHGRMYMFWIFELDLSPSK